MSTAIATGRYTQFNNGNKTRRSDAFVVEHEIKLATQSAINSGQTGTCSVTSAVTSFIQQVPVRLNAAAAAGSK